VKDFMECFCLNHLRLAFSHWSILPAEQGVNFLGYRIFPGYKLLRRDSVRRAKRRIRALARGQDNVALRRFLSAWLGHAGHADSHNLIRRLAAMRKELLHANRTNT
jgi:hypothetical protein